MVTQQVDIELPSDNTITSQIEPTNPTIESESPINNQLLESDIVNDPSECTVTEKVRPINLVLTEEPLKKPPTGKRVIDENKVPLIDAMDHETSEGLLLSETLNTVAENMEEDLVTPRLPLSKILCTSLITFASSCVLWTFTVNSALIVVTNPSILNPGPLNSLKVVSFNCQGLLSFYQLNSEHPTLDVTNLHEINQYLVSNKPDIFILNETWLKKSIKDSELFPPYIY